MKRYMTQTFAIFGLLLLAITPSAVADYYFSAPQNSGNAWIGGTSGGFPTSSFLSYPAISSQIYGYGPSVPWDATVDTAVPKGDYNLGSIPWIGEEHYIYFTVE